MDEFVQDNLPQAWAMYREYAPYIEPITRFLAPLQAAFLHWESLFYRFVYPAIYPIFRLTTHLIRRALYTALSGFSDKSALSSSSSSSSSAVNPEFLISIISTLILLWLSLRALDFVRRQVMWWVSVVTTLATWAVVLGVGFWVYQRGVEQAADDAAWLIGLVMGWSEQAAQKGQRLANEKEWDAERFRRAGAAGGAGARGAYQKPVRRGW